MEHWKLPENKVERGIVYFLMIVVTLNIGAALHHCHWWPQLTVFQFLMTSVVGLFAINYFLPEEI